MLKLVVASENLVLRNYLNDYFKNKINIEVNIYFIQKLLNHVYYNESDIIIVDINLKDVNGIEITEKLKDHNLNTHVIIYSDKVEDYTKIAAYEAGADDFFTTNDSLKLISKKIEQIDKKLNINSSSNLLHYNKHVIDKNRFVISWKNNDFVLPKKQFPIYEMLCKDPGKIFSRNDIYREIWDSEIPCDNRTLDVHIRSIRKILPNSNILTKRGIGYKVKDLNKKIN